MFFPENNLEARFGAPLLFYCAAIWTHIYQITCYAKTRKTVFYKGLRDRDR
jgi:hypothetical protein